MMQGNRRVLKERYASPKEKNKTSYADPGEPPSQGLTIMREDTWDAPLQTQRFVDMSDKSYISLLDPGHATSRCDHLRTKINCPCGAQMAAQECADCKTLFCGAECPAIKR